MKYKRILADYWSKHYVNQETGLCSLCGNTGRIDTIRTAISPVGFAPSGRINFCLCPNGRAMNPKDC